MTMEQMLAFAYDISHGLDFKGTRHGKRFSSHLHAVRRFKLLDYIYSVAAMLETGQVDNSTKGKMMSLLAQAVCSPNSYQFSPWDVITGNDHQSEIVGKYLPLPNLGNTCFMNVIVQLLINHHDFTSENASCDIKKCIHMLQTLTMTQFQCMNLLASKGGTINHTNILEVTTQLLKAVPQNRFKKGEQHDAKEFFLYCIAEVEGWSPTLTSKFKLHVRAEVKCNSCHIVNASHSPDYVIRVPTPSTTGGDSSDSLVERWYTSELVADYVSQAARFCFPLICFVEV